MKIKKKKFIRRLLVFIGIGIIFNLVIISFISLIIGYLETLKIDGIPVLAESLKRGPFTSLKEVVLGTGTEPAVQLAHTLYINLKMQGIFWASYSILFYKLLQGKTQQFKKIEASDHGVHGTARWATPEEIKMRFQQTQKGFVLGENKGKPCVQELTNENNNMTVVFGGSGSGKTTGYSITNILHIAEELEQSFFTSDPKGDVYNATAPQLKKLGYDVFRLNLLDFLKSHHYNPLHYVKSGADALTLVNTIMKNTSATGEGEGDFWEKAERSLYAATILYLKETRPPEEQHLTSVLKLCIQIGKQPALLNQLFEELPDDSEAKTFYDLFNLAEEKTRSGILIGFGVRLQLWALNDIQRLTATNDFDIRNLGKKKTAIFVLTRDEDSTFDLITAMFVDQTFQELAKEARTQKKHKLKVSVRMILDEIANIAPIKDLQRRVSVMRSRGVYISLIFQGLQQFKNCYGEGISDEISESCDNVIVLQATHNSTANPISEMLGMTTILTNSVSENESERGASNGMNYSMQGVPLMRAEQIRKKDPNKLLLLQKGEQPVLLDKHFYYKQDRWKNLQHTNWAEEENNLVTNNVIVFNPNKLYKAPEEPKEKEKIDLFA